ncbi:UDP-N-acetylmuramoyl-L-alanyl-D-glutamate--2,6-diaminopimelate ligase [Desulfovibrio sp. OttesenSCG-928-G15]|nr:UDP-N-acetylmuramoyl-L-alanyl-D-glutamate--2,6-diaminopimelate ligase [Desulfovibrio sp. OttesenSCG-928-G15]
MSNTRLLFADLCDRVTQEHIPVKIHSGEVQQGDVFVLMPAAVPRGKEMSVPGGERFLEDALSRNPGVVVCHEAHLPLLESLNASCAVTVVDNVRSSLGVLARKYYGTDRHCPKVIGITGTNGKTTETYLLEALFNTLGKKTGVIGTVSYRWPGHEEDAPLTTPGCLVLHDMLSRMAAAGAEYAFMEVSSHALDQERVAGIAFDAALMTNLTQDHLDYHSDMEEYFHSKELLFKSVCEGGVPNDGKVAVLNADDPFCRRILQKLPGSIGFGLEQAPVPGTRHLAGKILSLTPKGITLALSFEGRQWELASPLVGSFNALNLLGALAIGLGLGMTPDALDALSQFTGVSGRLERVHGNRGLNVFVDYAHTPDALVKAISALRDAGFARIITVFGCGGNRDKSKRPLMGKAVSSLTDIAVVTSDNPRDEDPVAIMDDIMPAMDACAEVHADPDRRAALRKAVELAGPDDAVLVAGKGHENYQIIKGVKHPFSDQEILRELMQ